LIPDIDRWAISILATDINHDYLERAKEGLYGERSFRGETPDWVRPRWFTQIDGLYQVDQRIRDMVHFQPLNLLCDEYPSYDNTTMNMDLVVCRNVTIYFDLEITRRIADRFFRSLNNGGWFIVGHSEPQIEVYQQFIARNFDRAVFYQKPITPISSKPVIDFAATVRATQPLVPVKESKLRRTAIPARPKPGRKALPLTEKPKPLVLVEEADSLWETARQAADDENWEEALALLREADDRDNLQPHVHYLRGLIMIQTGELDQALMALRQAVYCDPAFALAHYALGEVYDRRGLRKDAVRHWNRAREVLRDLDPDGPLPHGDEDLTAEMLHGLIDFRLSQ
jgi:chemotaxis protein methyltransferase CheR